MGKAQTCRLYSRGPILHPEKAGVPAASDSLGARGEPSGGQFPRARGGAHGTYFEQLTADLRGDHVAVAQVAHSEHEREFPVPH